MLTIQDYLKAYPEAKKDFGDYLERFEYVTYLRGPKKGQRERKSGLITAGMLKFTSESAEGYLCGPFPGDYAVVVIDDVREFGWKDVNDKPFRIYIAGNDDSSWSAFFASRQEARDTLALLEAGEPLDMQRDVFPLGFKFSN